jgi:hypothetical protein
LLGIITSYDFARILKRDAEYHLTHEANLRKIEGNINTPKIINFMAFLLEREVFHNNKRRLLDIDLDDYWNWRNILNKLNSVRIW